MQYIPVHCTSTKSVWFFAILLKPWFNCCWYTGTYYVCCILSQIFDLLSSLEALVCV